MMIAAAAARRPRVAVDTNVLMEGESLHRLLLAADEGHLDAVWSPQVVGELARAGLWRLGRRNPGYNAITNQQYRHYREQLYRRIDEIELRFEIVRSAQTTATDAEVAWAEANDPHDLHVQLLARTARADCVVSWNHRDFPGRQLVDGRPCGELCGVLWITPDQLPSLRPPALAVEP
jgi:PIN domain